MTGDVGVDGVGEAVLTYDRKLITLTLRWTE
jgi:hypothetical protein